MPEKKQEPRKEELDKKQQEAIEKLRHAYTVMADSVKPQPQFQTNRG